MLALLLALACSDKTQDVEALTAEVLTAPVTALEAGDVGAMADFAPVYPGQLQPPEGYGDAEGLRPLLVGPQGEAEAPGQAVVVFDRPMVALGALGTAPAPLACAPGQGRARWAGTSTAVWVPHEGGFPMASEVRCTVPKGTPAADGSTLERELAFTFSTPRPAVQRASFSPSSVEAAPDKPIVLVFSQGVDPDAVAEAVTLRPAAGGRALPVTATRPQSKGDGDLRLPRELERVVELRADLTRDTTYTLSVGADLRGLEGPRTLGTAWSTGFSTFPPARVQGWEPKGDAVSPYAWLRLDLATTMDGAELGRRLNLSPAPPDGFKPEVDWSTSTFSQGLRLEPMTTYTVTLAPGTPDEHGQVLQDPVQWSFTTGHYEPMLHAPDGTLLYPANNPAELPIRSRNLEDLYARLTPVSLEWVRQHGLGYAVGTSGSGETAAVFSGQALDDRVRIDRLDLRPHLTDGRGLVLVETWSPQVKGWQGQPLVSRALLQVTDLGASLKLGPEGLSTWVTRLSDGSPVAEAQVEVLLGGSSARSLWSGRTDMQGLAQGRLALPEDWSTYDDANLVVVVSHGADRTVTRLGGPHSASLWRFGVYSGEDRPEGEELRVYAFADRGVYKPGETVHVAWTARVADRGGLGRPAPAAVYSWACTDARGAALGQGKGPVAAHGGGAFDLALPAELAYGTGSCDIEVQSGETTGSASVGVPVRSYRTPAFRVDVSAPAEGRVGEALTFTGRGAYLFGAAMRGAEVRWTANATETTPEIPGFGEWNFAARAQDWWSGEGGGYESLGSGEGVLGEDGGLSVPLTLKARDDARAWRVEVEMTVTDAARQRISGRAEVVVDPAAFYLGTRARSAVGSAGSPATVDLVAVNRLGEVQAGVEVAVQVVRRTWDTVRQKDMDGGWTWVSNPKDETVLTSTARTGAQPVPVSFTPDEGGYYVLKMKALDSQGRAAVVEEALWVAGEGASWARGEDNLVALQSDRAEYKPGDVAKVLVRAPKAGLWGLVTVEREGVLTREVIQFTSTAQTVDIPLGEDAVPNVYVSVLLVEGAPPVDSPRGGIPDWYLGYTSLRVSPEGRRLAVELSTDRQTYQPGEPVDVRVKVRSGGAPMAGARVVLYAVDYGVLSLTDYQLPDAFEHFYAPHRLAVLMADSRTRVLNRAEYLVKGAEAGGGGGDEAFVRSRFVTTPYWNPDGVTDANGELSARFELPHNLTTFQLMAVVDGDADRFGASSRQIQVSRPLIARPALPRLLRVGDRALAGIVVHNNRDTEREVAVVADAQGVTLKGSPVTVTVPANGALEVPFALTDPVYGEATLRFDVQSGDDRDTVQVSLPVARPQPAETVATAGVVQGLAKEQIALPSGVVAGVGGLDLRLSSTVLVGVDDSLGYLVDYPHGCLEQTSSRLLALLLVRELGPRAGATLETAKIERYLSEGFAKLGTFRHGSGGYAMWPGGEPSGLATAYVAELLRLAQKPVPEDTVAFLRAFLAGQYLPRWWDADTRLGAQARAALALSRLGKGDAGFNARLYAARAKLPLTARAELLETIGRTSGADKRTADLIRELETHLYVEADRAVLHHKGADRFTALWDGDALPTATALHALMAVQPKHPLASRLARGLVTERDRGFWGNTYTTARSLQALAAYVKVYELDAVVKASMALAGQELLSAELGAGQPLAQAQVPIGQVRAGELTVQTEGLAYYEARLRYALPEMPPRDEGFTLTRTYRIVEGGGAAGQVTPGSLVQVTLAITTPIDRSGVAVIDPLPAGLEAVDSFFATTAQGLEEDSDTGYRADTGGSSGEPLRWSSWVFNHRELRDDGVYLYADWMPAGVHTYTWYARATTPGDYAQPAATVEEMYRPEVFGRTEAGRFVVGSSPVARAE